MSCVGYVSGALLNLWLSDKLGFGKVRPQSRGKWWTLIRLTKGKGDCTGLVVQFCAWVGRLFHSFAGAALQIVTYSVQAPAPPFPTFVAVNVLNGIGLALQVRQPLFIGAFGRSYEHVFCAAIAEYWVCRVNQN